MSEELRKGEFSEVKEEEFSEVKERVSPLRLSSGRV